MAMVFSRLLPRASRYRLSRFVAQPGQRRALVHDLPFIHQHFLQDAAFQVFDDLGVLGGNDLSLPPC